MKKSTPTGHIGCVAPLHDEVAIGTLRSILKQAEIPPDKFVEALK